MTAQTFLRRDATFAFPSSAGVVTMYRLPQSYDWIVVDGNGSLIDISSSTTQGLQEAINTSNTQGLPLVVQGGGQTTISGTEIEWSRISCTTQVTIPPGTHASYTFNGVSLNLYATGDGLVFDSQDMLSFVFTGQVVYTGTASCIRIAPTNANQENFIGWTSSRIQILSLVCAVSPANLFPDSSKGLCLRISSGTHPIINNSFLISECNAGTVGCQIDDPGGGGSVNLNYFNIPALHSSGGVQAQIGQTAAGVAIFGNIFDLIGGGTGPFLSDWGIQNNYRLAINAGTFGISLNTSAANNIYSVARNNATTPISDGSTTKSNTFIDAIGGAITAPSLITAAPATLSGTSGALSVASTIINPSNNFTLTLPDPTKFRGKWLYVKTIAAFTVVSASANVVPMATAVAGTAILAATAGKWAFLQSDATNWVIMAGN